MVIARLMDCHRHAQRIIVVHAEFRSSQRSIIDQLVVANLTHEPMPELEVIDKQMTITIIVHPIIRRTVVAGMDRTRP